ncbi:DoxX family protein [Marinoscillum sp. MHG1-6]|uniref:DoxX family protein n=1 Tax=Marinoscillum sp. MHG1-6 TaxID=2959627 RepID=UPI00215883B1|nr:DoxX family protein [Marinoscillum sp. MHG1-6]
MSAISEIEHWGDSHRMNWMVALRVALGGFLLYKGIFFAMNLEMLQEMSRELAFMSMGAAHYVLFAHLLGAPLIILGYYTRTACIMQIPVLLGAVIFVNAPAGFMSVGNTYEFWVSIVTLLLLVLFSIFGGAKYSLDEMRRNRDLRQGNNAQ